MKITKIKPLICHCYRTNWVFVKVSTDEGIHGVGEATLEYREPVLMAAIQAFDRSLRGRDPFAIEAIWHECYRDAYFRSGPVNMSALSGIEMALWDIMVEAHGRFNIATAVRIGRALEAYDIAWYEEPVPPDNLDALAEVKQRVRVPIAAGERLYSRWDYQRCFSLRCVDYIQPDPSHMGGIGEVKKIAAQAEANHLALCPHNPSGPVANAACLQLAACTTNFHLLETMALDVPWRAEVCNEDVVFADGFMRIPNRPGLGIDLNEEALAAHPYESRDLRHYRGDLTDIRPADAGEWYKRN